MTTSLVNVFLLCLCIIIVADSGCTGQCITSNNSNADEILNNLNATSCVSLHKKAEAQKAEVIPLQVNKSCMNGSHVEIVALFTGHQNCSDAEFLFVPRQGPDCAWLKRCRNLKQKEKGPNGTLCLLRCKTETLDDDLYHSVQLIPEIQDANMELCGMKLYQECDGNWTQPWNWNGGDPVVYRSLQTETGITLKNGTQFSPGIVRDCLNLMTMRPEVCRGIEVHRDSEQYVDLGQLPEACIANPSSCENGGSVSLWVKLLDCRDGGIITSDIKGKDGFRVYCGQDQMNYHVDLTPHYYEAATLTVPNNLKKPTGWFMMTLVLRGRDTGIVAYHDTTLVAETDKNATHNSAPGSGTVFIGRKRTNNDGDFFASLVADELTLWNRSLTAEEVKMMYQMYQE